MNNTSGSINKPYDAIHKRHILYIFSNGYAPPFDYGFTLKERIRYSGICFVYSTLSTVGWSSGSRISGNLHWGDFCGLKKMPEDSLQTARLSERTNPRAL